MNRFSAITDSNIFKMHQFPLHYDKETHLLYSNSIRLNVIPKPIPFY